MFKLILVRLNNIFLCVNVPAVRSRGPSIVIYSTGNFRLIVYDAEDITPVKQGCHHLGHRRKSVSGARSRMMCRSYL